MSLTDVNRSSPRVSGRQIGWAAFITATMLTLAVPSARWLANELANDVRARAGQPTPPCLDWSRELLRELRCGTAGS